MAKLCPICTKRHKDHPWLTLLDGREPGENMRAIGYRRHHHTGLDLMGSHPMPDDDGVLRCVTCLQAWDGRRGALVTGYELMCCGQAWVPKQATREANVPVAAKVRPPGLTAEAYLEIVSTAVRGMTFLGSHLCDTLMTEIGPVHIEVPWVFVGDEIDPQATARAVVEVAVERGLVHPWAGNP